MTALARLFLLSVAIAVLALPVTAAQKPDKPKREQDAKPVTPANTLPPPGVLAMALAVSDGTNLMPIGMIYVNNIVCMPAGA